MEVESEVCCSHKGSHKGVCGGVEGADSLQYSHHRRPFFQCYPIHPTDMTSLSGWIGSDLPTCEKVREVGPAYHAGGCSDVQGASMGVGVESAGVWECSVGECRSQIRLCPHASMLPFSHTLRRPIARTRRHSFQKLLHRSVTAIPNEIQPRRRILDGSPAFPQAWFDPP